jgi:hypothetical protein
MDGEGVPTLGREGNGDPLGSFTRPAPLDAADPDTDGDGLLDLDEVIGFDYEDLEGGTASLRPDFDPGKPALNPLSRDTDRDRLGDLQEVRLGTDPTGEDQDFVLDDDGDGLVNRVEEIGWEVVWYPVGTDPEDPSTASTRNVMSDPNLFDTDGDGLSDLEELETCRDRNDDGVCSPDEYFGPLDPRDADTDGDGLTDLEELNGVPFLADSANPVRYTDPLVADTDGDGRNDGDEVRTPWLVDVEGQGAYEVYSDPLRADADGDGLTDLEELQLSGGATDPNLADTDGDGLEDGPEVEVVRLLAYRSARCAELRGHTFGNLLIATLSEVEGDFGQATRVLNRLLNLSGAVWPVTAQPVGLVAGKDGDVLARGETYLRTVPGRVRELTLEPAGVRALPPAALREHRIDPAHPPGLYGREGERRAHNLGPMAAGGLAPIAELPPGVEVGELAMQPETRIGPWLLAAALALMLVDLLIALGLRGLLTVPTRLRGAGGTAATVLAASLALWPGGAKAQGDDEFALKATLDTRLAYIETGVDEADRVTRQGLAGPARGGPVHVPASSRRGDRSRGSR